MPRRLILAAFVSACVLSAAQAQPTPNRELEARFDALIDPAEMGSWIKTMAAEPTHVGSAHGRRNAEMTLAQFRSWGWDASIETFWVLYPTPVSSRLELVSGPGAPVRVELTEPPIPGD
jgi:N-acetylated-alpha-linked acidic dipeptidase